MDITGEDIEGLLLAAFLGALIGLDREYRGKAAGFRTLMLVSLGAAIFSQVSLRMALLDPHENSDVTRIASTIVTGIGFLGAGIIFRSGQDVKGLTTAATTWISGAIGMAAGTGHFALAVIGTAIILTTLFLLHYVEDMVASMMHTERYKLSWKEGLAEMLQMEDFFESKSFELKEAKLSKDGDLIIAEWTVRASKKSHEDVIRKMISDPRIVALEH